MYARIFALGLLQNNFFQH